mmetsp:Transcript_8679/g.24846  ORF Transcript_8679/g.24846 Transcript_8679/m.24846 type:complete len:253 (-) Transcript_8679:65-823(-)
MARQLRHAAAVAQQFREEPLALVRLVVRHDGVLQNLGRESVPREALHVRRERGDDPPPLALRPVRQHRHGEAEPELVAAQGLRPFVDHLVNELDRHGVLGRVLHQPAEHDVAVDVAGDGEAAPAKLGSDEGDVLHRQAADEIQEDDMALWGAGRVQHPAPDARGEARVGGGAAGQMRLGALGRPGADPGGVERRRLPLDARRDGRRDRWRQRLRAAAGLERGVHGRGLVVVEGAQEGVLDHQLRRHLAAITA